MPPADIDPSSRGGRTRSLPVILGFGLALCCGAVARVWAQDPTRFESEIQAYEAVDALQPPPESPVVFVGSSSIRTWTGLPAAFPNYPAINRGFGGSTMEDLLHYFDRLVAVYRPALVVVYEGDNDLWNGMSVEAVYEDFARFVTGMEEELPESAFALIAVKPSPSRAGILDQMMALNARLKNLAEERGGYFIDVYTPMVDESGNPWPQLFTSDNLHLNSAGYRLWRMTITPVLDQWSASRANAARFTSVALVDQNIVIEWEGGARLESADALDGGWSVVSSASPGHYAEPALTSTRFFRLVSEQE